MASTSYPQRWAVLVGINYYLRDNCLQGCVRDVEGLQNFLQSCSTPSDITILTSKSPYDPSPAPVDFSSRITPQGDPSLWPTLKNIEQTFARVTREALPGDLVYVHYSGHGTRLTTAAGGADPASERLALVVLEDSGLGDCYLDGERFRRSIEKMVAKGLIITVVLDCCFSGIVLRGHNIIGAQVRTVEYNMTIAAAVTEEDRKAIVPASASPTRDTRMLGDWLVDPQGYSILSSCSLHEKAQELRFPGTQDRNGALSHFLLETLQALQARSHTIPHEDLYKDLYKDLRIRFRKYWPAQTPMLYGNRHLSFFGALTPIMGGNFFRGYFDDDDGCFRLDAGEAQGICKGDEFELHPLDSLAATRPGDAESVVKGRVTEARHLTSVIEMESQQRLGDLWEKGWKAKLITSLSLRLRISIRLPDEVLAHFHTTIPSTAMQSRYMKLCDSEDTEVSLFNVHIIDGGRYEILDAYHQKVRTLPTIPLGAHWYLLATLQRLAHFRYMEQLENRKLGTLNGESVLIQASVIYGDIPHGVDSDSAGIYSVKHGSVWRLSIKNKASEVIYIAIFDITPEGAISNVLSAGGENVHLTLKPGEVSDDVDLRMTVPDRLLGEGQVSCQETIKLFASNRHPAFLGMIVPTISAPGGPVRDTIGFLCTFLADLTGPNRGDEKGDWTSQSFTVRTQV